MQQNLTPKQEKKNATNGILGIKKVGNPRFFNCIENCRAAVGILSFKFTSVKLPTEEAMEIGLQSYFDDAEAGFDLLHIDPTKDPHCTGIVPLSTVLERTVYLIEKSKKSASKWAGKSLRMKLEQKKRWAV